MPEGVKVGSAYVEVHANMKKAKEQVKDFDKETSDTETEIGVGANTLLAARQLAHVSRMRTALINVKTVGLDATESAIARLAGVRTLTDSFSSLAKTIGRLDKSAPKIATVGTAINLLSGAVLAGTSNILALGGSIASIAGAALALPGILGGIAVGAGVVGLAFIDVADVLGDLGPAFANLQDSISASFWNQAAEPIRNLVNTLLPQLQGRLNYTAAAMGEMFAIAADSITKHFGGATLGGMFDNLARAIQIAKGAIDPLIAAFATLATHGANYLPRLAQWFTDISVALNNFIQGAAADGTLQRWTEAGIASLQALGQVIGNIGRIFYGLYTAAEAAGGAGLQSLADGLGRIADVVNQPAFQGALTTIFSGAHAAMTNLFTALGPLGNMFAALAPTIARVLTVGGQIAGTLLAGIATALQNPVFATGLTAFFDGILVGVQAILPALPALAGAFGSFLGVVGEVVAILGPVFGTAIQALAPVFTSLISAIAPVAAVLAGVLMNALIALAPIITSIVTKIVAFATANPGLAATILAVAAGLAGLISGLITLAPTIVAIVTNVTSFVTAAGGLTSILTILKTAFTFLTGPIGIIIGLLTLAYTTSEPFRTAINSLVTTVMSLVTTLVGSLMPVFNALIPLFMTIINGAVVPLVNVFTGMLIPVVNSLMPIIQTVFQFIATTITNVMTVVQGVINVVTGLIKGDWDQVWTGIKQIFTGIWNQIKAIVTTAINLVKQVITAGLTIIRTVFSTIWNAIKNVVTSVWNGIRAGISAGINFVRSIITSGFNAVRSVVTSVWNSIKSAISSAWNSIRSFVSSGINSVKTFISNGFNAAKNTVTTAWNNISSAVSTGIGEVVDFVSGLPGKITGALGDLGGLLLDSGAALMQGLADGISGAVQGVIDTVSGVVGDIRDLFPFSPAKEGPFSGKGYTTYSGKALTQDFAKGILSQSKAVRNATESLMGMAQGEIAVGDVNIGRSNRKAQVNLDTPNSRGHDIITNNNTYHVTIDAKNVKDFNDVVDLFENLPQTARTGRTTTYRKTS